MPVYPNIQSGAKAQYPSRRKVVFATHVRRFLDGSEQRFRERLDTREWALTYTSLTETEARGLASFFETRQGRFGSFEFTDPWDGGVFGDCSLAADEIAIEQRSEGVFSTQVTVKSNR